MTAELLILLHYFKGEAAPLLRCLSCHFLFPHLVPARAGGGSGRAGRVSPGRVAAAMSPLCASATLGDLQPSLPVSPSPLGATQPLGWGVPRVGCPGQVPRMSPAPGRALGVAWPPASCALSPLFCWRFLGSGVTSCYFHSTAPTAALREEQGGLFLASPEGPGCCWARLGRGGVTAPKI